MKKLVERKYLRIFAKTILQIFITYVALEFTIGVRGIFYNFYREKIGIDTALFVFPLMLFLSVLYISVAFASFEDIKFKLFSELLKYSSFTLLFLTFPFEAIRMGFLEDYASLFSVFIIGLFLVSMGNFLGRLKGHLIKGVGIGFILFSFHVFIQTFLAMAYTVYVFTAGFLIIAYSVATLKFLEKSRLGNLGLYFDNRIHYFGIAGFLLGVYVTMRDFFYSVIDQPLFLSIFEVTAVFAGVVTVLDSLYTSFRRGDIEEYLAKAWRKHRIELREILDEKSEFVMKAVEDFVLKSKKEGLIVYVVSILASSGISQKEITGIVEEIGKYKDVKPPFFTFSWFKKIIEKQNMEKRIEFIKSISEKCKTIMKGEPYGG